MSKRKGEFVTLDELIDDIGVDAARFFLLQRSHDTTLDLDLDLARERSQENPVYYVQYAHARIASILRNAGEERVREAERADLMAGTASLEPAERALVKRLLELPEEVARGGRAARAAPAHRLRARARLRLPRLLPRLPRGGRRAARAGGLAAVPGGLDAGGDRPRARPARGRGARADVAVRTGCYTSWKKFRSQSSSNFCASMLSRNSSPVSTSTPIAISSTPATPLITA